MSGKAWQLATEISIWRHGSIRAGLVWLLLACGNSIAQPLQRNALVMRVDAEQIVRNETQWQTSWGDFSRDVINARVLVISLRQLGAGDPHVTVRWYFIGRDYDRKKLFIYDSGQTEGNIARGGIKLAPTSQELVRTHEQLLGTTTTSGQHPWGWAVFVEQDGRPLGETASVPELVDWTRKELAGEGPKPRAASKRKVPFVPQALPGVIRKLGERN